MIGGSGRARLPFAAWWPAFTAAAAAAAPAPAHAVDAKAGQWRGLQQPQRCRDACAQGTKLAVRVAAGLLSLLLL